MSGEFDMFDVRKRIASIESGKYGEEYHYVFDLVHAIHHKLHRIAHSTTMNVNQKLSSRLPDGALTCRAIAVPDDHPHLTPRSSEEHDWETISRYTKFGFVEIGANGTSVRVGTKMNVRIADHLKLDEDPKIIWVKFDIDDSIIVRSADGKEYEWKSLTWKPQKVDLTNGRNTLAPGANPRGLMIVRPTFCIRPGAMRKIQTDARKRIPKAIHDGVNELIDEKWKEAGIDPASS